MIKNISTGNSDDKPQNQSRGQIKRIEKINKTFNIVIKWERLYTRNKK